MDRSGSCLAAMAWSEHHDASVDPLGEDAKVKDFPYSLRWGPWRTCFHSPARSSHSLSQRNTSMYQFTRVSLAVAMTVTLTATSLILLPQTAQAVPQSSKPRGKSRNLDHGQKRTTPLERASQPTKVEQNQSGDWVATWKNDEWAWVKFKLEGAGVNISHIGRGDQPVLTGGQMVADSLRMAKILQPETIRITDIIEPRTLESLPNVYPSKTVLGNTIVNSVRELGGTITGWRGGLTPGYKPPLMKGWLEARVAYPQAK
jgi:hypothetical protein